jgi:hypothetical protein
MFPFLLCALVTAMQAQELPYSQLFAFQKAVKQAEHVKGVTCLLQLHHSREDDDRPFKVTLVTPRGQTEIPLQKDGTFILPDLPEEDRDRAVVRHDLEKGALSISFQFTLKWTHDGNGKETLHEECSGLARDIGGLNEMWNAMEQISPDFRHMSIAIVGLVIPREKPLDGKILVKHGDQTVKTVDLSETGPVTLSFDDFDPKEHRIDSVTGEGVKSPTMHFIIRENEQAAGVRNAIYLRKGEPREKPEGNQTLRDNQPLPNRLPGLQGPCLAVPQDVETA